MHLPAGLILELDRLHPGVRSAWRSAPRNPTVRRVRPAVGSQLRARRAPLPASPSRGASARAGASQLLLAAPSAAAASVAAYAVAHRILFLVRGRCAGGWQAPPSHPRGTRRRLPAASPSKRRRGRGGSPPIACRVLQQQQPRKPCAPPVPRRPAEPSQRCRPATTPGTRRALTRSCQRIKRRIDSRATAAGVFRAVAELDVRHEPEQPGGQERHRQRHDRPAQQAARFERSQRIPLRDPERRRRAQVARRAGSQHAFATRRRKDDQAQQRSEKNKTKRS